MKNYIYIIGACLLGGMTACQSDELQGESGEGYIHLSAISVDKNVQVRAGESEVIAVDITDAEGNTFVHADDWITIQNESYLVPAGNTYTINAHTAGTAGAGQGFDAAPYYAGSKEVTIKANQAETVEVVCKLAQSQVNVNFSDAIKENFTDVSCAIIGTDGFDLTFASDETRMAYAKAGQKLVANLSLTYNGKEQQFTNVITEAAVAATRYKINYDVNTDGNGNFTITVSQYVNEYEITLGMPLKPDGVSTIGIGSNPSKVWGTFAYLDGQCTLLNPTEPIQFQYKKAADSKWTTVNAEQVEQTNEYTAKVTGLDFGTAYEYKIVCGKNEGSVMTFTTEAYEEIPNLNLDTWVQNGKNWYPNSVANNMDAEGAYWATGNEGVTTIGSANSVPEKTDVIQGSAARLETVSIMVAGYAAGNLFIGTFNKSNASKPATCPSFGRPYSGARPTKFSFWYKYTPGTNIKGSVPTDRTLTVDECDIYIKLWSGDEVIAEEHFISNATQTEYKQIELPINYTNTNLHPTKITIVASSSHYGGEFSGMKVVGQVSAGSLLYVDEFELSYD